MFVSKRLSISLPNRLTRWASRFDPPCHSGILPRGETSGFITVTRAFAFSLSPPRSSPNFCPNPKGFSWFLILELSLHRYRCTAFLLARLCQSSRDDNRSNDRVWSKISHDGSRGRSETDSRSGLGEDDLQFTVGKNIFPSFVARTPSLRAKSCTTSSFLLPPAG